MRGLEMAIRTGLVLFALGLGAILLWPEASPGRLLSDSELAKIHGLNPRTRGNTTYPVGCEAFTGQQTPQGCAAQVGATGANLGVCTACSDKIATYTATGPGDSGSNQVNDGNYQCSGQMSQAPCTAGANGNGQCGNYAPVQGVFCNANIIDWDLQPTNPN
jgi:hypothetical protein